MAKRRRVESVDTLAIQLQESKDDFDSSMDLLNEELKHLISIKSIIVEKIRLISRTIKKTNRAYNLLDNKAHNLLNRINKAEEGLAQYHTAFMFEQQLRLQTEEQVQVVEEQLEYVENQLTQTQMENDDIEDRRKADSLEFERRFDFIKEAKVYEMMDTCQKFKRIKDMLQCDKFESDLRSIKYTMNTLKNIILPDEDEEGQCVICKSEKSNNVIIPCGHQCLCDACVKEVIDLIGVEKNCPYCQGVFTSIHRVYTV